MLCVPYRCQIGVRQVSDREGEMLCVSDRCQIDVREGMHYAVRGTGVKYVSDRRCASVVCVR